MLLLACLVAVAAAAPAVFDQRQDGEFNVRADVQNVLLLLAVPQQMIPPSLFGLVKSNTKNFAPAPTVQERAGVHTMEAFLEPNTPYHVEIGETASLTEGEGRAVEVVIAGRRRADLESSEQEPSSESAELVPAPESAEQEPQSGEQDEFKLIGAREQCGPDRERDPVTMICRAVAPEPMPTAAPAPAAVPAPVPAPAPADAPAQDGPSRETLAAAPLKSEVIVS